MPNNEGPVWIAHAFSRRNAGDGLLVDLTIELLKDTGIEAEDIRLLALDPDSFPDLDHVVRAPGEPAAKLSKKSLHAAGQLLQSFMGKNRVADEFANARAIVAVGGGYLVADSGVRQAGVMLNHFTQLKAAAKAKCPTVYLPQSIGPLEFPTAPLVRKAIQKLDRVWVRDDETLRELPFENVRRCADLAVMKLARSLSGIDIGPTKGSPVIVGRDLSRAKGLGDNLNRLAAHLENPIWAVQAETEGKRSDREFYRQLAVTPAGRLSDVMRQPTGPVVSIRLHGAVAALLAGRPAIHLAYERKGWGAFEDLGLGEYVHDARDFDPARVASQVAQLEADASQYWANVKHNAARISLEWDQVVSDLQQRIGMA